MGHLFRRRACPLANGSVPWRRGVVDFGVFEIPLTLARMVFGVVAGGSGRPGATPGEFGATATTKKPVWPESTEYQGISARTDQDPGQALRGV